MAIKHYRSTTVDALDNPVSNGQASLYGFNIINRHSADIYIKFYDKLSNAVDAASDTPVLTLQVTASSSKYMEPGVILYKFGTALSIRAVTENTDTGTTAPATKPIVELQYD